MTTGIFIWHRRNSFRGTTIVLYSVDIVNATRFIAADSSSPITNVCTGVATKDLHKSFASSSADTFFSVLLVFPLPDVSSVLTLSDRLAGARRKSIAATNVAWISGRAADHTRKSFPRRHTRPSNKNWRKSPASDPISERQTLLIEQQQKEK